MSARAMTVGFLRLVAWMGLLMALATTAGGARAIEQKFPLLQIGTQFFTNATVTTHTSNYVFILHSGGMASIKVTSLDDTAREILGYPTTARLAEAARTNSVIGRAKSKVASLQPEEFKNLKQSWTAYVPKTIPSPRSLPINVLLICCAILLLGHLFFSFCCKCICEKAGTSSGPAIWLPILQIIPMLRAAGMSPLWLLAFFVPILNLVAQILWSFKIVQARGKSPVVAIGLILPITNILSFLYLAFSRGGPDKPSRRGPEIMTLETA